MTTILEVRHHDDGSLSAVEYHWTPQEGKRYLGQLTGEAVRARCLAVARARIHAPAGGRRHPMTDADKVAAIDALLEDLHHEVEHLHARYGRERVRLDAALADRLGQCVGEVRAVVRDVP
jgi:hypothetical protein